MIPGPVEAESKICVNDILEDQRNIWIITMFNLFISYCGIPKSRTNRIVIVILGGQINN